MTAMTNGQALVGAIIIIGFFAVLAGVVVFTAAVIADFTERYRNLHPDAGRSESPHNEGPPAPTFTRRPA